jgi:MFS family permease
LVSALLTATAGGMVLLLLPIDGLALGGVLGGFALPGMIAVGSAGTPLWGALLVVRAGHKNVMIGGLALCALATLPMAGSDVTLVRGLGALGYGVGLGLYGLSRITYLSDAVPTERRGRIVSAVGGMGRVGMFLGPAAGGLIAQNVARDAALLCAGGLLAVAACVLLALPACPTLPAEQPRRHALAFVGQVLSEHRRTFATVGAVMLVLAFVRSGRMLLIPICGTLLGLPESEVGFVKARRWAPTCCCSIRRDW